MFRTPLTLGLLAGLASCALALGEPPAPPPKEADALAGPKVTQGGEAPRTLVVRDFDGNIRTPEPTVEEAAVALLDLSPAERKAVEKALSDRAAILDAIVLDNLALLGDAASAGAASGKEKFRMGLKAYQVLEPLRDNGSLRKIIGRELTPENKERFEAVVDAYWDALVAERRETPKADGKKPGRLEIIAEARLAGLGKEIERSFQRVLMSGELIYKHATRGITLSEEQSEKIRGLLEDHMRETGGNADEKQNQKLALAILPLLTLEQQKVFVANIRDLMSGNVGKPTAAKAPAAEPPAGNRPKRAR